MRAIVPNASDFVCQWTAEQLGQDGFNPGAYGMGILKDDKMIAGVVYHDHTEHNCFISLASVSPHWASRMTLRAIFAYPFNQLGVDRVTVTTEGGRPKWRKMLTDRLGFTHEAKLIDWHGEGKPGYLYRMTRNECRWLNELRQGRIEQQRAAV